MFRCVGNEIGSFERYVTKKSDLVFRCKIPFFQPPSTQNMFWFVGNEVGLLWGLNHKKRRFCFFVAKTRCFLRAAIFSVFLPKTCFGFFKQLNWKLWALYHKKTAIWFYHWKLRCLKLHNTDNMFCFVINNIGLPWALYRKKKCFCFFFAKTRCNQLYSIKSIFWFVCRKIVLLPAFLHLEKVFFQFAVSHLDFHFILLKTTFLPVFS